MMKLLRFVEPYTIHNGLQIADGRLHLSGCQQRVLKNCQTEQRAKIDDNMSTSRIKIWSSGPRSIPFILTSIYTPMLPVLPQIEFEVVELCNHKYKIWKGKFFDPQPTAHTPNATSLGTRDEVFFVFYFLYHKIALIYNGIKYLPVISKVVQQAIPNERDSDH
jgi:hypothetical protein